MQPFSRPCCRAPSSSNFHGKAMFGFAAIGFGIAALRGGAAAKGLGIAGILSGGMKG